MGMSVCQERVRVGLLQIFQGVWFALSQAHVCMCVCKWLACSHAAQRRLDWRRSERVHASVAVPTITTRTRCFSPAAVCTTLPPPLPRVCVCVFK